MQTNSFFSADTVSKRASMICACALFFGFLTLYVYTLCPTVYAGDSGEITTAIWSGGIIHPPGYPLFALLGRLFLFFPLGEPAFRVGLMVALGAAGAVTVLYQICRTLDVSPLAAACAAATFGTGYSFWSQSVRVEVYSVHVFLVAAALLFALRYRLHQNTNDLYRAAAVVGLGIGHHLTIVLAIPALLVLCGRPLWTAPRLAQRLITGIALLLTGPALYLLFLLWANDASLHNWSRPSDLQGIWTHSSARIYQGILHLPTASYALARLSQETRWFFGNFLFVGALLSLYGAVALWKKTEMRVVVYALGVLCITVTGYNACYHIGDITGYYLVCWLAASLFLAVAFDAIPRLMPRAAHPAIAVLALIAVPLIQGIRNFADCNLHDFTVMREFARQKLEHCDPNAVLITKGDDDGFYLQYVQEVLGVRRDVLLIDRDYVLGTWFDQHRDSSKWYLYRLRAQGIPAPLTFPQDRKLSQNYRFDAYLISLLQDELKGRPLFMTFAKTRGQDDHGGAQFLRWTNENYTLLPQGVVVRALPKTEKISASALLAKNRALWNTVALPSTNAPRTDEELTTNYVNAHYASMLINYGYLYELVGEPRKAQQVYEVALQMEPGNAEAAASIAAINTAGTRISTVNNTAP